jgi:hypothetical protein
MVVLMRNLANRKGENQDTFAVIRHTANAFLAFGVAANRGDIGLPPLMPGARTDGRKVFLSFRVDRDDCEDFGG